MSIVRKTERLINRYMNDFRNGRLKKPEYCGVCGKKCELSWHANYMRGLITLFGKREIPIKRLFCPLCKHTFALIPEFIEKFHRYAKDVIEFVLKKIRKFVSYKNIADGLMAKCELNIEILTFYKWKKKFCA